MSREYNPQGIHKAELELHKAEKQLKRWGGKQEVSKYINKRNQLDKEHETARECERLRNLW